MDIHFKKFSKTLPTPGLDYWSLLKIGGTDGLMKGLPLTLPEKLTMISMERIFMIYNVPMVMSKWPKISC